MNLIQETLETIRKRNPGEPEFLQAATEVLESIAPAIQRHKRYVDGRILERLVEPERIVIFRVPWQDDQGRFRINRGFRI